jgi:4-aminobutyrate aminotransferase
VSCAAAVAVADAFKEEKILDNVRARYGLYFSEPRADLKDLHTFRSVELFKALGALKADPTVGQHILDVRGQGLMVAVEFASPSHSTFDPAVRKDTRANLASNISKRCLEKGMLLLTTSVYETVRFIPPLNISSEDLARGVGIFKEAVEEVVDGA